MFGAGVYNSRDSAATLAALRDMVPGCILLFQDGLGLAEQVRAEHPDALIFGRLYCDDWSIGQLEHLADVCLAHPANAYLNGWQSENEPDVEDYESAQRVARRDKGFAEKMLAANRWALVFNGAVFKPTNPLHLDYWRNVLAIPNAILNYHGYVYRGSPLEDTSFRYRRWNLPKGTRIICSEWNYEPGGYKALGITEDKFLEDFKAIAAEWQRDGLIGSAVFCIGDSGGWQHFDILGSGIPKRLGDDNRAHPWPASIAAYPQQEEEPMMATLAVQYPELYRQWVTEGGDPEGEFRRHLLGIGAMAATQADLDMLVRSVQAGVQQAVNVAKLPQVSSLPN